MKSYKVIDEQNTVRWYNEFNRVHREDGPAVEYADGEKLWYQNDQLHREDGPAVEYTDGSKEWYLNDQLHREDGPAIEHINGDKSWYLQGKWIDCSSQQEFERLMKLKAFW